MENGKWNNTDGFELIRPLDGGRGRVWLARETALQRDVALKFQTDASSAARAALLAEADILARCDHPSIVPFYRTVVPDPPAPAFYVMKALPANSSTDQLTDFKTGHALAQLASALAYLHGLSPPVAHGGVTPGNVIFDGDGRAVLAGFGSARVIVDGNVNVLTEDVWALGRVFEETFAHGGRRIPRNLRPLLARMLSADPVARPTAAEVSAQFGKSPRRGRLPALTGSLAAIVSIVLLAAAAIWLLDNREDEVVDEISSPVVTTDTVLNPRLPSVTPELLRRIPWYCRMPVFPGYGLERAEVKSWFRRFREFEDANPDWKTRDTAVWPGALRIIHLPGSVQIEFAGVPGGFFRRGFFLGKSSRKQEDCNVGPDSVFVTRGFWMARTELTRAQYAAVMRRAPAVAGFPSRRLRRREGRGGRPLELEGGDLPVGEDLGLADIQRFIDALNELCGLEGERRFRLPTEAEWELACRAFVARPFEGEKRSGDAAWTRENSGGTPHPVALKAQNPLGLFDMHGNLAEWCADAYGPLADWPPFDPCAVPASNDAPRVVRGGSFHDSEAACDSNARAAARPTDKGYAIRLVALP